MPLEIKLIAQTNTTEMESRALTPVRNMATRGDKGDFSVGTVSSVRAAGPSIFSTQCIGLDKTAKSDDGENEDKLVIDLCPDTFLDSFVRFSVIRLGPYHHQHWP
jgi:hypothetical protein